MNDKGNKITVHVHIHFRLLAKHARDVFKEPLSAFKKTLIEYETQKPY